MPTLSLKKVFLLIIGIVILSYLKDMLRALSPVYEWFCYSLDGIRDFPDGAQAAIAVAVILLVVVLILRMFNKL